MTRIKILDIESTSFSHMLDYFRLLIISLSNSLNFGMIPLIIHFLYTTITITKCLNLLVHNFSLNQQQTENKNSIPVPYSLCWIHLVFIHAYLVRDFCWHGNSGRVHVIELYCCPEQVTINHKQAIVHEFIGVVVPNKLVKVETLERKKRCTQDIIFDFEMEVVVCLIFIIF